MQEKYLRETGCPTEAPCIRSLSRFTRRLVVFSPITKLIASIKLDLPVKQQTMLILLVDTVCNIVKPLKF